MKEQSSSSNDCLAEKSMVIKQPQINQSDCKFNSIVRWQVEKEAIDSSRVQKIVNNMRPALDRHLSI